MLDDGLPADAAATVTDVVRMLGQARKAVAERPAFLEADNDRLRELLSESIRDESGSRERIRTYLEQRTAATPGLTTTKACHALVGSGESRWSGWAMAIRASTR